MRNTSFHNTLAQGDEELILIVSHHMQRLSEQFGNNLFDAELCRKIAERPVVKDTGARLNFLSGSSKALQKAQKERGLEQTRLYLAGWWASA